MTEGWFGDDYLISLNQAEVASASDRYSISRFIPGHQVIGLRGWDDLIVRDSVGLVYTVPSVPMDSGFLSPYVLPEAESSMVPDERFVGKIKWYVQPIVFAGDPNTGMNVIWVNHEEHAPAVTWWNDLYRSVGSLPSATAEQYSRL
jgi:hypothetical protein